MLTLLDEYRASLVGKAPGTAAVYLRYLHRFLRFLAEVEAAPELDCLSPAAFTREAASVFFADSGRRGL